MTERISKECLVAATTIKAISKMGFLIFFTTPVLFILLKIQVLNITENITLLLFLITAILTGFKAWHLYFDGTLLKNLASGKFEISDMDESVYQLFRKKNKNKCLELRIQSCYKIARLFFALIIFHLSLFFGLCVWIMFSIH